MQYPYNLFETNQNISFTKLNNIYSVVIHKNFKKISLLDDYKDEIEKFITKNKLELEQLKSIKLLEKISKDYYYPIINNIDKKNLNKNIKIYYEKLIYFKDIISKNKFYIKEFNDSLKLFNIKSIKEYNPKLSYNNPLNIQKLEYVHFDKPYYFNKINSINNNNFKISLDILTQGNNINLSVPSIGLIYNKFSNKCPCYTNFISKIISIKEVNYKTNQEISESIPFISLDLGNVLSKILLSTSNKNNDNSIKKILKNIVKRISLDLNDIFYSNIKNNNKIVKKLKTQYIIPYKYDIKDELVHLTKLDIDRYRDVKTALKLNNDLITKIIKKIYLDNKNKNDGIKILEKKNFKNILACYLFYIINLTYDILKNYLDKIDDNIKYISISKNKHFGILNIKEAFEFTSSLKMSLYKFKLILLNSFYYLFLPTNIFSGNYGMEIDEYNCFLPMSELLNDSDDIFEKYPFKALSKTGTLTNEEIIEINSELLYKFILNSNNKYDIYKSDLLLELGGWSFSYSTTKKACSFLFDYYSILEKSNMFDIFIIDIIINNTNKYKKIPIELINILIEDENNMIRNDLSKNEKYDLEKKIYNLFDTLMEKSINYWIKIVAIRKKINNSKKNITQLKMKESIYLLCFNTFYIKAEYIFRTIKFKISDINLKNLLIEKCLKRKKYYEKLLN